MDKEIRLSPSFKVDKNVYLVPRFMTMNFDKIPSAYSIYTTPIKKSAVVLVAKLFEVFTRESERWRDHPLVHPCS